jgi:hypothetical protein
MKSSSWQLLSSTRLQETAADQAAAAVDAVLLQLQLFMARYQVVPYLQCGTTAAAASAVSQIAPLQIQHSISSSSMQRHRFQCLGLRRC